MTFKGIDSTAYGPDKPLDTFLLKQTRANLQAVRAARGRSATWSTCWIDSSGAQVIPRLCGFGSEGPQCLYFFWTVRRAQTVLGVDVYGLVGSDVTGGGTEVTLGARWYPIDRFLQGDFSAGAQTSVELTGGATSPSNTTLALDVTAAQGTTVLVELSVLSAEGTEEEIQNASGSGPDVFEGFNSGYYVLENGASNDLNGGDEVPCFAARVLTNAGKVSENVGEASFKRQVIRQYDNGGVGSGRFFLFVWPRLIGESVQGLGQRHSDTTDSLWKTPLGHLDLYSVRLYDSALAPIGGADASTDASRAASYGVLAQEAGLQTREWLATTRVHALGPEPDVESTDDRASSIFVNRLNKGVILASGYKSLGEAFVGRGDSFTQRGVSYKRASYRVHALLLGTMVESAPGSTLFELDFRLQIDDFTGSDTVEVVRTVEIPVHYVPQFYTGKSPTTLNGFNAPAYLAGFNQEDDLLAHALKGGMPRITAIAPSSTQNAPLNELTFGGGWLAIEIDIVDTSQANNRRLRLQVRAKDGGPQTTDKSGTRHDHPPRIHVFSFKAEDRAYETRHPTAAEIGA